MSILGQKLNTEEIQNLLFHIFKRNEKLQNNGSLGTPIMIWGNHGLGKTELVKSFAQQNNWKFAYCAPAQFEEMGDLHGMPTITSNSIGNDFTSYSPPEWVPTEDGPGILLLDDVNRADDRILRGLMQLFQNYSLHSWSLPKNWQIVATANPDDGNYSVTPLDDAFLTRLLHVTLKFDVKTWALWAQNANIDSRGINFALTYPESITGRRTTPRSLVHFFNQITDIVDLKSNIDLVIALAKSALDDITVSSFISFIKEDLICLLNPEDIIDSKNFKEVKEKMKDLSFDKKGLHRVDRIATICTRLYFYLKSNEYKVLNTHKENLVNFFLLEEIPNDLKMSLFYDLNACQDEVKELLVDQRLSKLLIASM